MLHYRLVQFPSPPSKPESFLEKIKNNPKTAIVLIGAGLVLVGLLSAFYVWYSKLLGKGPSGKKNAEGTERSRSDED